MQLNFYVPEAHLDSLLAKFRKGRERRSAITSMMANEARVTLTPSVRAATMEISLSRRRRKEVEVEFNADYLFRGEIVAGVKSPSLETEPTPREVWTFVLDCGFHTRLDVRDTPLEDPFDPSNVRVEGPRFKLGDYVELVGTLEGRTSEAPPPFTSSVTGLTKEIVPIAREIGAFLTMEVVETTPFRLVASPSSRPPLLTAEEPDPEPPRPRGSLAGRRR